MRTLLAVFVGLTVAAPFASAAEKTTTALELYDVVLEAYPDRLNRGVLWNSAKAVKK